MSSAQFPHRRGAGAFEVALPCASCGDEVAISYPANAGNRSPARLVARCRTCQEVAYIVARGDDGVARVHPCGPGPYASWPADAWRPPPKQNNGAPIYGSLGGPANRGSSNAMGPAGRRPAARAASAPRLRSNNNNGAGAQRRGVSAERVRFQPQGPLGGYRDDGRLGSYPNDQDYDDYDAYDMPVDAGYRAPAYDRPVKAPAYDRAGPANRPTGAALLRPFAAAVFQRFPDEASAFRAFDLNGTGVIGMPEFQMASDSLRFQGDAASVFFELDTGRRGYLGRPEFAMLRRWAPQAARLRPTAPPQGRRPEVWDRYMPPAGNQIPERNRADPNMNRKPVPGSPASVANNRYRKAQNGLGVAAAMDSWGEWRNWQEDDFSRPNQADQYDRDQFDYDRPANQQFRQHAWDVPEQRGRDDLFY